MIFAFQVANTVVFIVIMALCKKRCFYDDFAFEATEIVIFAMILGVLIGTYSSIFVASPMLKFFKVTYKTLEKEEEKIVP